MPEKRLIAYDLQDKGNVCAIGAVGVKRGVDMSALDPHDPETLSGVFGIAHQIVREIEYMNDEAWYDEKPEHRWSRMREWAASKITPTDRTLDNMKDAR